MAQMTLLKRAGLGFAGALALAGSFYAGVAYAADARLDQANAHVTKAVALLGAAENPGVKQPFGGHRAKAVRLLRRAQSEIAKAKQYADSHQAGSSEKAPKGGKKGDKEGKNAPKTKLPFAKL